MEIPPLDVLLEGIPPYMKRQRDEDEGKVIVRRYGMATNKRRFPNYATQKQVHQIYKKLKMAMPLHMVNLRVGTEIATEVNNGGQLIDMHATIAEGDTFSGRFGTVTRSRRMIGNMTVRPGSASTLPSTIRCAIVRAPVGATLANTVVNLDTSSASVRDNVISRVYYDKWFSVPATPATVGFAQRITFNIALKNFRVNYSGAAAGTNTGETIFMILLSGVATGTAAPLVSDGLVDVWFQP